LSQRRKRKVLSVPSNELIIHPSSSSYYQTPFCSSSSILKTFGLINNQCYVDGSTSTKVLYPYFYGYAGTTCSGAITSTQNVETSFNCAFANPSADIDDAVQEGSYLDYSLVSGSGPTMAPSSQGFPKHTLCNFGMTVVFIALLVLQLW
jgi:hypothetical protein